MIVTKYDVCDYTKCVERVVRERFNGKLVSTEIGSHSGGVLGTVTWNIAFLFEGELLIGHISLYEHYARNNTGSLDFNLVYGENEYIKFGVGYIPWIPSIETSIFERELNGILDNVIQQIMEELEEGEDKMEKSVNMTEKNEKSVNFKDILKEMEELYDKKNNDYGNSFNNSIDEFGLSGVVVRLNDKMNRLKHLTKGGEQKVKDESIYDTFLDMANYSAMTCAYLRSKGKI